MLGVTVAIGVVVGASVGYLVGEKRFAAERVERLGKIELYRQVLTDAVAKQKERPQLDAKLQAFVAELKAGAAKTGDGAPAAGAVKANVRGLMWGVCFFEGRLT